MKLYYKDEEIKNIFNDITKTTLNFDLPKILSKEKRSLNYIFETDRKLTNFQVGDKIIIKLKIQFVVDDHEFEIDEKLVLISQLRDMPIILP